MTTVNGIPILTVETVQEWFKEAFGCVPSSENAGTIAAALNHYAFLSAHWKTEFKEQRRNNPSTVRLRRISEALTTLQNDLPVLMDDTRKVFPDAQSDGLVAFLDSVNSLELAFQKFKRPRGREPELWHNVARNLGKRIIEVAEASGVMCAGLGKPDAPAIKVLKCAFDFLGVEAGKVAICDAVRPTRKRMGK